MINEVKINMETATEELQVQEMGNKLVNYWNTTVLNFDLLKLYGEVDELFQAHLHHA